MLSSQLTAGSGVLCLSLLLAINILSAALGHTYWCTLCLYPCICNLKIRIVGGWGVQCFLKPPCLFGRSLKMVLGTSGTNLFHRGCRFIDCNPLLGMPRHTVSFDAPSSPWRQNYDPCEVEPGGNVIVLVVGTPTLTATAKTHQNNITSVFPCSVVTSRLPPTRWSEWNHVLWL